MAVTLTLTDRTHVVANIWLFTFAPSRPLVWTAGQFIKVELPHSQPDTEGTKRFFTIASAPADGHVQIATRITGSTFKQTLARLPIGGRLNLVDLPAGDFVWPARPARPLVFAAQGIGVTPVRSMLRQRLADRRPITATLVYANLTPGIPFSDELAKWGSHPEFTLHQISRPITAATLNELVPNLGQSLVYVTGPKSLAELLMPPYNLPISSIKHDQFPNYAQSDY